MSLPDIDELRHRITDALDGAALTFDQLADWLEKKGFTRGLVQDVLSDMRKKGEVESVKTTVPNRYCIRERVKFVSTFLRELEKIGQPAEPDDPTVSRRDLASDPFNSGGSYG